MTHLLDSLAESIDLSNLRIINFPSLIFLCGGPIPKPEDNVSGAYLSLRHYVKDHLETSHTDVFKKIILAEKINDWFRDGYYKDLLTFERELAGLAAVIVIFVESPGSIAELAVFSYDGQINKKLLIFINSTHYGNESFIHLGPITYLEQNIDNNAHVYDWGNNKRNGHDCFDTKSLQLEDFNEVINSIIKRTEDIPEEQQFNIKNHGHALCLLADIIDIMGIVKKKDLEYFIDKINTKDIYSRIDKYLFILDKLKLIARVAYGKDRYYIGCIEKPLIKYSYKTAASTRDRLRWKMLFRDSYINNDARRERALVKYKQSIITVR